MRARHLYMANLAAVALIAGCAPDAQDVQPAVQGRAPMLSKADAADRADHACQIILRSASRQPGGNDYQTQCTGSVCNYLWKGGVELAEGVQGKVRVLYHLAGDPTWWQVDATPSSNGQPGFSLFEFGLSEHLFGPGKPTAPIELMPYVELADGSRLFDHNRRTGDLENYVLDGSNYFGLGDGGACAPVAGRISFLSNWQQMQFGELRQGGTLVVDYMLDRLPTCRGTHNGHPAWDLVAHARFLPGGEQASGSVRVFEAPQGTPTNVASSKALAIKIPSSATAVELWFHNFTGAGSSCEAWDSNYGKNYRFDVWPPASDPRCKGLQQWSTQNSDMPYRSSPACLGYLVDPKQNYAADHCELAVTKVGDGYMGHYGIPVHWLEAEISAGPQLGQLLSAAMWVRYVDSATGAKQERVTLARQLSPGLYQTGFIYDYPGVQGSGAYHYTVDALAFFIDVKRPTGEVVRLWQSRHGANYTWKDAFTLPVTPLGIAYGNIQYANAASGIFDLKQACGK